MAHTIAQQNSTVDFRSLHACANKVSPCSGISHLPISKFLSKHNRESQYCVRWGGVGSNSVRCLRHRAFQRSVCIDRVHEVDLDEWSVDIDKMGIERRCGEEMYEKRSHWSSPLDLDGRFVGHSEDKNNDALWNFCSHGKLVNASRLIDIMARRNQIPDFPSCRNLIRGLVKINQIDKATKILKIMVMSGGVPDIITYNMMVGGFCKKGQLRSAIDLVEDMSRSGCPPDVITYNTIIRAMFDTRNFEQAIAFWKEELRKGCPPYIVTYTVLIELICRHCGIMRAVEVLDDMVVEGYYPDIVTYNSLVNFTCRRNKLEDTALVIHNLLSLGFDPNVVTYNTILHSLCGITHKCITIQTAL